MSDLSGNTNQPMLGPPEPVLIPHICNECSTTEEELIALVSHDGIIQSFTCKPCFSADKHAKRFETAINFLASEVARLDVSKEPKDKMLADRLASGMSYLRNHSECDCDCHDD